MCYFHLEIQGLDGSADNGEVKPVLGWWQCWIFSSLQELLQDAREVCGQERFVHVICSSQKQNLWMIHDTSGWSMNDFSAAQIPVRISGDLGS